jgi:alanine racemase
MNYTVKDIAEIIATGTEYHISHPEANIERLLIDSRALLDADGTLFFALQTARANGHDYIAQLYVKGVRNFVVSTDYPQPAELSGANFIAVADTAQALRKLATYHRSQFNYPVVGITGSNGKTLVKEWLFALLSVDQNVARSPRSYNSQIGVPLSLWQMNDNSSIALIEAGISQSGEMETLREMINPDIAIITNIGQPHDDGFVNREAKIAEKLLLAREAKVLIYPAADTQLASAVESAKQTGALRPDITLINSSDIIATLNATDYPALTEAWQLENLATCIALMRHLGYDDATITARTHRLRPMGTRLNVIEGVNHCMLVADDYTCDLHSLIPALDFVARRTTADRTTTLILSDISHETASAEETYAATARVCALKGIRRVIGVGVEISRFSHLFPQGSLFFGGITEALAGLSPTDFDHELILVKGDADTGFDKLVHMLEARTHESVLEVNLDAMVSNFNFYRSFLRPETGIVAMVKASGYGAGSYELAKTLQSRGAAYLAVAVLDEGIDLRKAGITMPIMVLNPKVLNYRLLFANNLEPEIFSFDILNEIIAEARKYGVKQYPVHIKLDTGMHRLGFDEDELDRVIDIIRRQDNIRVCSVFSHLATADCLDLDDYTEGQLKLFDRASQKIVDAFPYRIKRHILNTAGIVRYPQYQYDMVRLGIGLYGVPVLNNGTEAPLRQVSTLRTVIISLKEREATDTIGYGRRGKLSRKSLIATIPIGYADGINRHMGRGNVSFLVNGVHCPTVGNICMDICMIDVTDVPDVKIGDSVIIFGEENPVGVLAEALDTIPYELLTAVSPRVRRVYYSE